MESLMWKKLDPSKIISNVCMQCAACCKHTVRYDEKQEKYAKRKIEYLMAMFNKPREDFTLEENENGKWRVSATFKCKQLLPDNGCKIYKNRAYTCERFNCFETANNNEAYPENWKVIKELVD